VPRKLRTAESHRTTPRPRSGRRTSGRPIGDRIISQATRSAPAAPSPAIRDPRALRHPSPDRTAVTCGPGRGVRFRIQRDYRRVRRRSASEKTASERGMKIQNWSRVYLRSSRSVSTPASAASRAPGRLSRIAWYASGA
jgi:hypothetical protein